jgi:hypothetical protein
MKGNRDRFHAGEDIFFPNPVSQMMFMIKKTGSKKNRIQNKELKIRIAADKRS